MDRTSKGLPALGPGGFLLSPAMAEGGETPAAGSAPRAHYGAEMLISGIVWPDDRVEHIAKHGISPNEFEDVCFGHALVLRGRSEGASPVYHASDRRTPIGTCFVL